MKTSIQLTVSLLLFTLSVSASSWRPAQDDQSATKAFVAAVFPAADAAKLWLCLEKHPSAGRIDVELISEQGRVLFRETLPAKSGRNNGYRQQFDLSQVEDGTYTFRLSAGGQTEVFSVNVSTPAVVVPTPARLITMN